VAPVPLTYTSLVHSLGVYLFCPCIRLRCSGPGAVDRGRSNWKDRTHFMPANDAFATQVKELLALGASVAAGCRPCTEYHVRAARSAGACDSGTTLAIETAVVLRNSATRGMDRWAERCQGSRPELDPEFRAKAGLITELVSITAAVCVNSVADLTIHLTAARQRGAAAERSRSVPQSPSRRGAQRTSTLSQLELVWVPFLLPSELVAGRHAGLPNSLRPLLRPIAASLV
jgi:AhpD family alkylhydroperoxidase